MIVNLLHVYYDVYMYTVYTPFIDSIFLNSQKKVEVRVQSA